MSDSVNPAGPEPAVEAEASPNPAPAGYQVSFWRRPWVQAVVPWATSLSVHIGIITVALVLLASGAFQYLIEKATQQQAFLPTATLAETSIGGVPNVGNMDDVTTITLSYTFYPAQQQDEKPVSRLAPDKSAGGATGQLN